MGDVLLASENVVCDLCTSVEVEVVSEIQDRLHGIQGTFYLKKCRHCGFLYLSPRPGPEEIVRLYRTYYDSANCPGSSSLRARLRKSRRVRKIYHAINGEFIAEILRRSKGKVLDVGCGSGVLLEDLRDMGCEASGIEVNPDSAASARAKGFDVFCGSLEDARFPDDCFDTIILNHVLEHVPSPKAALREIRRILKPGGKVLIQSPNEKSYMRKMFGPFWAGWHIPFHFNHFSPETIRQFALGAGFKVRMLGTATPDHHFLNSLGSWTRSRDNVFLRNLGKSKIVRSAPARLLFSCIFRFMDMILPDQGDCLRVELEK